MIEKDRLLTVKEFLGYEKRASIISFSNIIAVFAGFVIFVAGLFFISVYILPNLTDIPVETWEKLLYFLDFSLIFLCNNSWLVFLGCLAFFASLTLSYRLGHLGEETEILEVMSFILFFGWSIVAIYHQNHEIGYLAITALGVFSNCPLIKRKLPESLGFTRSSPLPGITISSFIFVMIGSLLHLTPVNLLTNPFVRPLLFIGALGYFVGIFILPFQLDDARNRNQDLYSLLQIITFLSGLASIFFPPMFDIPFLQGIGQTMFVVWLSTKYARYADWTTTWSSITSLFGLGILLYGFAYFYKAISLNFSLIKVSF